MSFLEWLAQPACRAITLTLLHFVWQGFIITLGLVAFVKACQIARPSARYAASLTALVAMTIFPIVTFVWISLGHESLSSIEPLSSLHTPTHSARFVPMPDETLVSTARAALGAWQPYVLVAWSAGVGCFGCRLLLGAVGVSKLRRSRLPIPPQFAARFERVGHRLQMNARGLVFLSNHVTEAMALGLVRKLVLIPAAWITEMPPDMLEAVIAHELAHLRRLDLWANLLQRLVETMFFYHPAVWWLSRRLRVERELCADELAVAATGERLIYAQTLEHIAKGRRADIRPALAAFLRGESNMRLLQRIRNVLAPPANERRHWPAGLVALGLAGCLWTLSFAVLDSLSRSAYAAQESAQDEANSDAADQSNEPSQKDSPELELEFVASEAKDAPEVEVELVASETSESPEVEFDDDASDVIERKIAEAVERALAQAEEIKKRELDKAARNVEEELNKVRLHHIQLANEARDKARAARDQAQNKRAADAAKLAKNRFKIQFDKDRALLLTGEEDGKPTKARYRKALDNDPPAKTESQEANDARIHELSVMVKELSAQVAQLSKEFNALRKENAQRGSDDAEDKGLPRR
jgi:beta-lactamase regulating signal transducer with metallopeptidase domain